MRFAHLCRILATNQCELNPVWVDAHIRDCIRRVSGLINIDVHACMLAALVDPEIKLRLPTHHNFIRTNKAQVQIRPGTRI